MRIVESSVADVEEDYFLIAKVDSGGELAETDESNNEQLFSGGVFLAADGTLHVHGTSAADTVSLTQTTDFEATLNGQSYTHTSSQVSAVHVRTIVSVPPQPAVTASATPIVTSPHASLPVAMPVARMQVSTVTWPPKASKASK